MKKEKEKKKADKKENGRGEGNCVVASPSSAAGGGGCKRSRPPAMDFGVAEQRASGAKRVKIRQGSPRKPDPAVDALADRPVRSWALADVQQWLSAVAKAEDSDGASTSYVSRSESAPGFAAGFASLASESAPREQGSSDGSSAPTRPVSHMDQVEDIMAALRERQRDKRPMGEVLQKHRSPSGVLFGFRSCRPVSSHKLPSPSSSSEVSGAMLLLEARNLLDKKYPLFNRALRRRLYSENRMLSLSQALRAEAARMKSDGVPRKVLRTKGSIRLSLR